jgi:hypothetical protein
VLLSTETRLQPLLLLLLMSLLPGATCVGVVVALLLLLLPLLVGSVIAVAEAPDSAGRSDEAPTE